MTKDTSLEKRGPVAWITLSRPPLDASMIRGLRDACEAISGDAGLRAVVVTGIGKDFTDGIENPHGPDIEKLREAGVLDDPFGCLAELTKPVICAIASNAVSGKLALALAADIRIASEDALFWLPEIGAGGLPLAGAIQRLARLVGRGRALEMVLTGEPIDAAEALRIGLVGEVVPHGELDARAQTIAERLAERGPLALQYAKEAIARGLDMPLEQAMRFETDLTLILQTTEDRAEGVRAFLEKRKPEFKGR
jgi:enoyl-CoA hydratase